MSRKACVAAAICVALGLAACGGSGSDSPSSGGGTSAGGGGATTAPASGTGASVASAIESSRGGLTVSCPSDVSLEKGAKFECDFTDDGNPGKLTVTVTAATGNSATISYDGKASGIGGLTLTASGSGIDVKK